MARLARTSRRLDSIASGLSNRSIASKNSSLSVPGFGAGPPTHVRGGFSRHFSHCHFGFTLSTSLAGLPRTLTPRYFTVACTITESVKLVSPRDIELDPSFRDPPHPLCRPMSAFPHHSRASQTLCPGLQS